ncbi:hypothetical protein [Halomarina rubra]|uniref:Uncharacterized protein n=1 Tax=Halomarina rubra TaxID=2071873 RepID=A0ABD6AV40_9EURY|nr:hypothetical protein [Halomarina rubra]
MVQSVSAFTLDPTVLLAASLATAAVYFLLGLVGAAAVSGRTRAVAQRLTRTAALPAIVGFGTFAFVATLPPETGDLFFLLGTVAVVLSVLAAPVLAVTLALDPDAV